MRSDIPRDLHSTQKPSNDGGELGGRSSSGVPEVKISDRHVPVLLSHVLDQVHAREEQPRIVVDGTLGAGGHARHILEICDGLQRYIGVDKDPQALEIARGVLGDFSEKVSFTRGDFRNLPEILESSGVSHGSVDVILLDLGVSSMQLDDADKGFSFIREGPLDMRMDPDQPLNAADIVNGWPEEELGRIIRDYGEDRCWRRYARCIVEARDAEPIKTTTQLADLIYDNAPREWKKRRTIHPATLVFQGLRVEVNSELDAVTTAIPQLLPYMAPKGQIMLISFHSLEDRIVKRAFLKAQEDDTLDPRFQVLTKRPLIADDEEIEANSRSRSAKLRVLQRMEPGQEPSMGRKKNKYAHLRGKSKKSSKASGDDEGTNDDA